MRFLFSDFMGEKALNLESLTPSQAAKLKSMGDAQQLINASLEKEADRLPAGTLTATRISSQLIGNATQEVEAELKRAASTSRNLVQQSRGTAEGIQRMFDAQGKVRDFATDRLRICTLLWLCWEEIQLLGSVTELFEFIKQTDPQPVTRKNLERVCSAIHLTLKKPGAPRKTPIQKSTRVGIKKKPAKLPCGHVISDIPKSSAKAPGAHPHGGSSHPWRKRHLNRQAHKEGPA